jgi:hypothetical protein
MISALVDRYRCPEAFLRLELAGNLSPDAGYFRLGSLVCYGRSAAGYRTTATGGPLYDVLPHLETTGSKVRLPFNPSEVIENLRLERYARSYRQNEWNWPLRLLRDSYYLLRPVLGIGCRKHLQRLHVKGWERIGFPHWPVDTTVEQLSEDMMLASMKAKGVQRIPFVWFWPGGSKGCVMMTHDIEGQSGHDFCRELMDIDDRYGIKAAFSLVPHGTYKVSKALVDEIRGRGFEIAIQDLNHDGYLFAEPSEFLRRVAKINEYGRAYGAKGFRAAVLYRNLDWYDALELSYDMSVPNVAHLDPQRGGCCTVTPYFVGDLLEIPLTTTQDYALLHLLGESSLDLWKSQVNAILNKNGLISLLIHPDYVIERSAQNLYCELLSWLRAVATQYRLWFALPSEVDDWWRARSKMRVAQQHDGEWRVEGQGSERAVLAFAVDAGDHVEYEVRPALKLIASQNKAPRASRIP